MNEMPFEPSQAYGTPVMPSPPHQASFASQRPDKRSPEAMVYVVIIFGISSQAMLRDAHRRREIRLYRRSIINIGSRRLCHPQRPANG